MNKIKHLLLLIVTLAGMNCFFASCDIEELFGDDSEKKEVIVIGGALEFVNVTESSSNQNSYVVNQTNDRTRFHFILNGSNTAELGFAWIDFFIPTSSFTAGKDVTNDISEMTVRLPASYNDIYTSVGKTLTVKSGKVEISKLTDDRAYVVFNGFVVKLGDTTLNIKGNGSCKIQ